MRILFLNDLPAIDIPHLCKITQLQRFDKEYAYERNNLNYVLYADQNKAFLKIKDNDIYYLFDEYDEHKKIYKSISDGYFHPVFDGTGEFEWIADHFLEKNLKVRYSGFCKKQEE